MTLQLYNSLTRKKEAFKPLRPNEVGMYVCGPTVYDRAHLGNARAVVVYDVLYRVLSALYLKVNYIRNITDVDDKINAAAKANKEPISALTERTLKQFHEDMAALNCLPPSHEPRATNHIGEMIAMIEKLIAGGNAYIAEGHVLYAVKTNPEYGILSGRKAEEQEAGARVAVEKYKRDAGDFVLWKPADKDDDVSSIFDSPWGKGRPGWHIECSAMSTKYLTENFDIHGGGADLKFPHHENEIAQSTCAHKGSHYANYWVHNGFLTVNGEKMSKSLGNFITVRELLDKGIKGEVIRFALLSTHYSKPLDWTEKLLDDSVKSLKKFHATCRILHAAANSEFDAIWEEERAKNEIDSTGLEGVMEALSDDLNTPIAISMLHTMAAKARNDVGQKRALINALKFLGLIDQSSDQREFGRYRDNEDLQRRERHLTHMKNTLTPSPSTEEFIKIEALIAARNEAKAAKNFAEADRLRAEIVALGVTIMDRPGGVTEWRKG